MLNLLKPEHSYFIGFSQADGSLNEQSRNRGKFTIEIKRSDKLLLKKFQELFNCYSSIIDRTRNTNFKDNYDSTIFTICDLSFRLEIKKYIPIGKKSEIVAIPTNIKEIDYWRGFIDGDGSIIITSNNIPMISLTTKSELIKDSFLDFLKKHLNIKKNISRNKRDNIYNICLYKEDAQHLVSILYYDDCLCLDRKLKKSQEITKWNRPKCMKKRNFNIKRWNTHEDKYIVSHSIDDSVKKLNRTIKSVKTRLWRLNKK